MTTPDLIPLSCGDTEEWAGHRWAGMISKPLWFGNGVVPFQVLGFHTVTNDRKQYMNSTVPWNAQRSSVWWVEAQSCEQEQPVEMIMCGLSKCEDLSSAPNIYIQSHM